METAHDKPAPRRGRGRPRADETSIQSREQLLEDVLTVFSDIGYEGTSIRQISQQMNISHNLLNAKFGSKRTLWEMAVDHGISRLAQRTSASTKGDSIEERLHSVIVAFLEGLAESPAIWKVLNYEGARDTDRLDYIVEKSLTEQSIPLKAIVLEGIKKGVFRKVSVSTVFFLMSHGGGAPLCLTPLASHIGVPTRSTKQKRRNQMEEIADIIVRGIKA